MITRLSILPQNEDMSAAWRTELGQNTSGKRVLGYNDSDGAPEYSDVAPVKRRHGWRLKHNHQINDGFAK
jgi:hypothetical protein